MRETESKLRKLTAEFSAFAIDPKGLFLLDPVHATRFIRMGVQEGLELQGVESFRITPEGAFQPEQEYSNDIADGSMRQTEFVEKTIELITNGGLKGLIFQIVFN